jgi:hypothetical protein
VISFFYLRYNLFFGNVLAPADYLHGQLYANHVSGQDKNIKILYVFS